MHGHTQKIQIAIAKDPLCRKNQQTMCIQDPTHIFSFPLLANYLVEPQCMADENHGCCASLVKTLALSHASNKSSRVRPLSFMSSMILASDSGFENRPLITPRSNRYACNLSSVVIRRSVPIGVVDDLGNIVGMII